MRKVKKEWFLSALYSWFLGKNCFLIDNRLFLFYEGATSYDAKTGKEKEREKFKINEDGLALTEADPVIDENYYENSTNINKTLRAQQKNMGPAHTVRNHAATPDEDLPPLRP